MPVLSGRRRGREVEGDPEVADLLRRGRGGAGVIAVEVRAGAGGASAAVAVGVGGGARLVGAGPLHRHDAALVLVGQDVAEEGGGGEGGRQQVRGGRYVRWLC